MSSGILLERIARSVYHAVRKELVRLGYLPDILLYPNTVQGEADYKAAISAVVIDKGYAIEVFGHGSSDSKKDKKVPRIVINFRRLQPGDLGGDYAPFFEVANGDALNPDTYLKKVRSPLATNWQLDVIFVTNEARQEYIMYEVMARALPKMGYIPLFDESTDAFFIRQIGFYENPDAPQGFIEKVYLYEIPDIFEIDDRTIEEGITPITQVTIDINIKENEDDQITDSELIVP